jgi:hypothetical protein
VGRVEEGDSKTGQGADSSALLLASPAVHCYRSVWKCDGLINVR